jgi:hypothetical protein
MGVCVTSPPTPPATCTTSKITQDNDLRYQLEDTKFIDVTLHKHYTLLLLEDGSIIRDTGCQMFSVTNNRPLDSIFCINGKLHGTARNKIYVLTTTNLHNSTWNWDLAPWNSSTTVQHVSITGNKCNAWVQDTSDGTQGTLYKFDYNLNVTSTSMETLDAGVFRVYGHNSQTWMDIDTTACTAQFIENGNTGSPTQIVDIKDGIIFSDGVVVKVSANENTPPNNILRIRNLNDSAFRIQCCDT